MDALTPRSSFLLVVITPPTDVVDEQERALQMLREGIDRLHIRKPTYTPKQMAAYLAPLCEQGLGDRLVLHSCFSLSDTYALRGIHWNEQTQRHPECALGYRRVSWAVHDPARLPSTQAQQGEYILASPFFASISKPGYRPRYTLAEWERAIAKTATPVIALGGVVPQYLSTLRRIGCGGAAFLGYLWQTKTSEKLEEFLNNIKNLRP